MDQPLFVGGKPSAQTHARGQFTRQKMSPTDKEASGTFQLLE